MRPVPGYYGNKVIIAPIYSCRIRAFYRRNRRSIDRSPYYIPICCIVYQNWNSILDSIFYAIVAVIC